MIQSAKEREEAADKRIADAFHAENTGTETARMFVIRQRAAQALVLSGRDLVIHEPV